MKTDPAIVVLAGLSLIFSAAVSGLVASDPFIKDMAAISAINGGLLIPIGGNLITRENAKKAKREKARWKSKGN